MTQPTVQTAKAPLDANALVTWMDEMLPRTPALLLMKLLRERDSAIRADEREKALEEAAQWLEETAAMAERTEYGENAPIFRANAKAIRALASPPPQPTKQEFTNG